MQRMVSDRLSGMAASCGRAMRARIILRRAKQDTEIAETAGPAVPRLARYAPHLRLGRNASPVRAASLFEAAGRSEEHTSELQSRLHLVCRLLLEKKKKQLQYPAHSSSLPLATMHYLFAAPESNVTRSLHAATHFRLSQSVAFYLNRRQTSSTSMY